MISKDIYAVTKVDCNVAKSVGAGDVGYITHTGRVNIHCQDSPFRVTLRHGASVVAHATAKVNDDVVAVQVTAQVERAIAVDDIQPRNDMFGDVLTSVGKSTMACVERANVGVR